MKEKIQEIITDIFIAGLDEDAFYWKCGGEEETSLQELEEEYKESNSSLEKLMIQLLIDDIKSKNHH